MAKTGASIGLVFAVAAAFGLVGTDTRAAKPTVQPDWSCAITFADRPGDVIRSDGNNGFSTYTNGVDLVNCYIHSTGTAALAENLHFQTGLDRRDVRRRSLHIEGQTYPGASYPSDDTVVPDYFEVWRLRNVTSPSLRAFRVTTNGSLDRFRGDSYGTDPLYPQTSSVFVTPIDACSWDIEFNPAAPLSSDPVLGAEPSIELPRVLSLIRYDTHNQLVGVIGRFPLPFKARVVVIANKPGCPLQ